MVRRKERRVLQLAAARFDVFVTADQNLQYQQNLSALPITVAVLVARDNQLKSLLVPATFVLEYSSRSQFLALRCLTCTSLNFHATEFS